MAYPLQFSRAHYMLENDCCDNSNSLIGWHSTFQLIRTNFTERIWEKWSVSSFISKEADLLSSRNLKSPFSLQISCCFTSLLCKNEVYPRFRYFRINREQVSRKKMILQWKILRFSSKPIQCYEKGSSFTSLLCRA